MGSIVLDDKCRTNVRGCYAAGDAVTNVHQVILAAASGVRAAVAICTDLLREEAAAITGKSIFYFVDLGENGFEFGN